ncbi:hypothetical protein [Arsenicibacter rosenii]|nr:hypothetical protein [Arsenicibacter rosenii]
MSDATAMFTPVEMDRFTGFTILKSAANNHSYALNTKRDNGLPGSAIEAG